MPPFRPLLRRDRDGPVLRGVADVVPRRSDRRAGRVRRVGSREDRPRGGLVGRRGGFEGEWRRCVRSSERVGEGRGNARRRAGCRRIGRRGAECQRSIRQRGGCERPLPLHAQAQDGSRHRRSARILQPSVRGRWFQPDGLPGPVHPPRRHQQARQVDPCRPVPPGVRHLPRHYPGIPRRRIDFVVFRQPHRPEVSIRNLRRGRADSVRRREVPHETREGGKGRHGQLHGRARCAIPVPPSPRAF
mmetsp:Transcript_755/g.2210  ORF Transcript_755/g.2210 Transcript_755/m.2210 type:complete len:245 (-) Transcript_755:518-1252(-)